MGEHLPGHDGDIAGRGMLAFGGQACAVDKVRVGHAQFRGALVHLIDAHFFRSIHDLGHGHSGIVGASHDHALQQDADSLLFRYVQQHLGTAHARGIGRDRHDIVQADASLVNHLQCEQDGHNLGD